MATEIYRPTMSSDVVFELVDILEQTKRTTGLSMNMRKFLGKLDSLAYDIGKGNRAPAYVATGTREKQAITLEALGAASNNVVSKTYVGIERRTEPTIDLSKYTKEQIEDAKERELFEFTVTGEHTDWHIYLPKLTNTETINIETEQREENLNANIDISDEALFKSL